MNDEPLITLLFISTPAAGFMLAGPGPFLHPSCLLVGREHSGYSELSFLPPAGCLKGWAETRLRSCCSSRTRRSAPSWSGRVRPRKVSSLEHIFPCGGQRTSFALGWFMHHPAQVPFLPRSTRIDPCGELPEAHTPAEWPAPKPGHWSQAARSWWATGSGSDPHQAWQTPFAEFPNLGEKMKTPAGSAQARESMGRKALWLGQIMYFSDLSFLICEMERKPFPCETVVWFKCNDICCALTTQQTFNLSLCALQWNQAA